MLAKEEAPEKSSAPGLQVTTLTLTDEQFASLSRFIEDELGIKMPPAKKIMLESRLQKRLRALNMKDFGTYLDFVFSTEGMSGELLHMIDVVTTNKTDFFREPDHFYYLLNRLLPEEAARSQWGKRRPMRVWSAGCSTGEEPYTLAMILELFRESDPEFEYSILATDISTRVLEKGATAIYDAEKIEPVPIELRKRFLLRSKDREKRLVRIQPHLRRRVSFQRVNLMQDDFGLDELYHVIFCRNVIIYFERKTQEALLAKLYDQLSPGGYLFLGHSETLTGMQLALRSVAPTIYRKEGR
jgi:chemotaxis protein methyltransferase CheR